MNEPKNIYKKVSKHQRSARLQVGWTLSSNSKIFSDEQHEDKLSDEIMIFARTYVVQQHLFLASRLQLQWAFE